MIGDRPAGMITFATRSCHWTADPPAAAIVEPITPPMRACDELDGMPSSQVRRFQVMPPASPAKTTGRVTRPVSTRPLAIVAATASDKNAPTRFRMPDRPTATRGLRAFVAIEVAMALPVSWKPLVKSNPRAVTTTSASTRSFTGPACSGGHSVSSSGTNYAVICHRQDYLCSSARCCAIPCAIPGPDETEYFGRPPGHVMHVAGGVTRCHPQLASALRRRALAGTQVAHGVSVQIAYVTESFPPDVNGVSHT